MRLLLIFCVSLAAVPGTALAENWPAWRGPHGTGVAAEQEIPIAWSATENVAWKTPLPAPGNSTPVVWQDRVFLTAAEDGGARRTVMCLDRADGKLLWQQEIAWTAKEPTHETNPFCSASPVTDGQCVIAWHGSAGMVAYDFSGQLLWRRELGDCHHIWGNASSPVLDGDHVLAFFGPGPKVFLAALDKRTGEDVWRIELPEAQGKNPDEWKGSWSTPILHEAQGRREILLSLPQQLAAFDPASGRQLWSCRGLSDLVYTSPLVGDGVIVAMSGYHGPALAVRTGGDADVTETHRLWRVEQQSQRVGSGLVLGEHVYNLNEQGDLEVIELMSGRSLRRERLGAKSWSSLVLAAGRLYALDMDGETFVLSAGPDFKVLNRNPLGELTRASPAISDGQIFIRTYEHLYCIGQRTAGAH